MTRLAIIALMSLSFSCLLVYGALRLAEVTAAATTPRIEIALNQ